MTGGRPLRFLALTLGGWIAVRIALLLPDDRLASLPSLARALVPDVAAAGFARTAPPPRRSVVPRKATPPPAARAATVDPMRVSPFGTHAPAAVPAGIADDERPVPSPYAPPRRAERIGRFAGSAWMLARGGGGGTLSGGQLGASQAGVRITYALDDARRVALAARFAAPLRGRGREAALGVEWQPTDLPIRLIAEQRIALDRGRGGPTLGLIGGYGPAGIARGVRLEAYGQAGGIYRSGVEGFVDASARITHGVGQVANARVDIGVGAWGSAQRDATRFDIGPSVALTLPVARKAVRLTLDWRQRIAGRARPGSGLALSIGSDF